MRIRSAVLLLLLLSVSNVVSRGATFQQDDPAATPQTLTLYPPLDKATGAYDESRACFSFKLGRRKLPHSIDWDLGYGFMSIDNEDWINVGTTAKDKRSVMKEIGEYKWSDAFKMWALDPLPELRPGEQRKIRVDASADTHKEWAKSTTHFAKATAGHMYLIHVKDDQADFHVLARIEELQQGDHCTISWKRIPTPESAPPMPGITRNAAIKVGTMLARKKENGVDNYPYAAFSFELGGNGPEVQKQGHNNWDILFGNSSVPDAFDVTFLADDRSRIRDLGSFDWDDRYEIGRLPAYEEPEREPGVKAVEGHLYLVHSRDNHRDFYSLFRVEKLEPGKSVEISWKRVPTPGTVPSDGAMLQNLGIKMATLLARRADNYAYAAFSFEFGGNGPEVQKLCRNDWDILFGNSSWPDGFDVTVGADDRSRIRDLGRRNWDDKYEIGRLSAYEEPEREPSVKAVEGHLYLVHTRDTDSDVYAMFRVEKLEPGKSVEISWKVIPPPKKTR